MSSAFTPEEWSRIEAILDEVLEPVDRDVFRRQNRYFEALQPNAAAPAPKAEK